MKCPKCSYIGFEEADRCRNCGYEFALSRVHPVAPEMPMRYADDDGGPLADLELGGARFPEAERQRTPAAERPRLDLDRMIGVEPETPDLPLFDDDAYGGADLPPLISAPASPRRPLAVRRQTLSAHARAPLVARDAGHGGDAGPALATVRPSRARSAARTGERGGRRAGRFRAARLGGTAGRGAAGRRARRYALLHAAVVWPDHRGLARAPLFCRCSHSS